jgi:hypothetical protein
MIYIFLDNQVVADETTCFKINVTALFEKHRVVDIDKILDDPDDHKE